MCNCMCNDFWLSNNIRLWSNVNLENTDACRGIGLLETNQGDLERSETSDQHRVRHVSRYRD